MANYLITCTAKKSILDTLEEHKKFYNAIFFDLDLDDNDDFLLAAHLTSIIDNLENLFLFFSKIPVINYSLNHNTAH